MVICKLCGDEFKKRIIIDGKYRNLQRRKYCFKCSPFGSGNTRKLEKTGISQKSKKTRDNKKFKKWQRKTRQERKEKLVDLLGRKCIQCSYNKCIGSLDFHHRDPEEKKFDLCASGILKKWKRVLEEVKKCDLLCANCHRELHYEEHKNRINMEI